MFTDWQAFRAAFLNQLQSMHGKSLEEASPEDKYTALAVMVREYISNAWVQTNNHYENKGEKQV